jgi:hypothetical protein
MRSFFGRNAQKLFTELRVLHLLRMLGKSHDVPPLFDVARLQDLDSP